MRQFRVMALAVAVVGGLLFGLSQATPTFATGGTANNCFQSNCAATICNPGQDVAVVSGFHGVALANACGLSNSFHNTAVANAVDGGQAIAQACLSGTAKASAFGGAVSVAAACGASNVIGSGSAAVVDARSGGQGGAIAQHPNSNDFNVGLPPFIVPEQAMASAGSGGYANASPGTITNASCTAGAAALASGQFSGTQLCVGGFFITIN